MLNPNGRWTWCRGIARPGLRSRPPAGVRRASPRYRGAGIGIGQDVAVADLRGSRSSSGGRRPPSKTIRPPATKGQVAVTAVRPGEADPDRPEPGPGAPRVRG